MDKDNYMLMTREEFNKMKELCEENEVEFFVFETERELNRYYLEKKLDSISEYYDLKETAINLLDNALTHGLYFEDMMGYSDNTYHYIINDKDVFVYCDEEDLLSLIDEVRGEEMNGSKNTLESVIDRNQKKADEINNQKSHKMKKEEFEK